MGVEDRAVYLDSQTLHKIKLNVLIALNDRNIGKHPYSIVTFFTRT